MQDMTRVRHTVVRGLLCVAGIALASGCAAPDRGYVQKEWSDTFRELGIVPLFPPREDVIVGDLYAYDFDPESEDSRQILEKRFDALTVDQKKIRNSIGMSPRLWRANLNNSISDEYLATPAFPKTPPADLTLLAGTDVDAGVKVARARVTDADTKVAEATQQADTLKQTIGTLERDIPDLQAKVEADSKIPPNETPEAKKTREERLDAEKKALKEKTEARPGKQKEFDIATKMLALRQEELVLARKALEALEQIAANPPKRFDQPANSDVNVFTGTRPTVAPLDERVNRLRLVGFPDFSSTTFTEGNLSALVPIEALMVGVNANFSNIKRVTVRVPAAESYGLSIGKVASSSIFVSTGSPPPQQVHDEIDQFASRLIEWSTCSAFQGGNGQGRKQTLSGVMHTALRDRLKPSAVLTEVDKAANRAAPEACESELVKQLDQLYELDGKLTKNALGGDFAGRRLAAGPVEGIKLTYPITTAAEACQDVYVRVPTEVYYARALDISVFGATAGGARVTVNQVAEAGQTQGTASPGPNSNIDLAQTGGADLLTRARAQLGQVQPAPGGAVQLVSMSEHSVGLRRTYDRPVAIGFRGVTLRVNRLTGIVLGAQPSSGYTPTEAARDQNTRSGGDKQ